MQGKADAPQSLGVAVIEVEAADAKSADKKTAVKLIKASADYANPERPLEPNFDDRSGKKRITGPVSFAIDSNDLTAWGIDAGPGRRNVDRKAVFVPDRPIEMPEGAASAESWATVRRQAEEALASGHLLAVSIDGADGGLETFLAQVRQATAAPLVPALLGAVGVPDLPHATSPSPIVITVAISAFEELLRAERTSGPSGSGQSELP